MSGALPLLFMVLAGAALLGGIFAFWQSLRVAFGAADPFTSLSQGGSVERQALEDEKASLLRSLQDLKFEWQIGKLSDGDYKTQEASLRSRAREVMRLLDADVEPFREKAEKLVQESLADRSASGRSPYRERGRAAPSATKDCSSCGTTNDSDAEFCKKCGKSLGEAAATEADSDEGSEPETSEPRDGEDSEESES